LWSNYQDEVTDNYNYKTTAFMSSRKRICIRAERLSIYLILYYNLYSSQSWES